RSTELNSDPLVSSVHRMITPALYLQRVNHVPQAASGPDYLSSLLSACRTHKSKKPPHPGGFCLLKKRILSPPSDG
ncbi:hypothetical protein, partial [Falsigemmobacter faecalis]|uniref:hypothetical protein n=1 Tax=Falsigemmobacter faecalis TaxID=2488730 RepID=UPI001F1FF534